MKHVVRLFHTLQPKHYVLSLTVNKEKKTFDGQVELHASKVGRPSKRITLHQNGLKITHAEVIHVVKGQKHYPAINRINHHASRQEVRIHTETLMYPGEYYINVSFSGKITDAMQGIYPCYFEHEGMQDYLIATQFESHYARMAFPCIDEPEAKAVFELNITLPEKLNVLSNTPVARQTIHESIDQKTVYFEPTPRMSSYLVAFALGDIHGVSTTTSNGVVVSSWASKAQELNTLHYSLDEAVKILDFFEDYFGTPYPLKKLDQIALPDFDAGAMENWGLITYREIALLTDPINRSVSTEQYVSLVIAHEISHQWFGNLVTMKWWDDLWLNESFASLMEHVALDALHPDWKQWEFYTATDVISTSNRDVYRDIQPVSVCVTDPDLLDTLFDPGIVYAKGGRLLRMLMKLMGETAFTSGLSTYFKEFQYKNATRDDLWKHLESASSLPISKMMTSWIIEPGMPLLRVNQKENSLQLTQERFLLDEPTEESHTDATQIWPIPLLAASKELAGFTMHHRHQTLSLEKSEFVILNEDAAGHFITHYQDSDHLDTVKQLLLKPTTKPETKIGILNDFYMLSRHGEMRLNDSLDILKQNNLEPREAVWATMFRSLGATSQLLEEPQYDELLKSFRRYLSAPLLAKLGWQQNETESVNDTQLRSALISLSLGGEDPDSLSRAHELFSKPFKDIPAEIRATIMSSVVRQNSDSTCIDRLVDTYRQTVSPDIQLDTATALSSTKDPLIAKELLSKALGQDGFVRSQDTLRWLALFLRNKFTKQATWQFIESSWPHLQSILSASKSYDYLPIIAASVMSTTEWLTKYDSFFEPLKNDKTLARNISIGRADIIARVAWREREETLLSEWLHRYFA